MKVGGTMHFIAWNTENEINAEADMEEVRLAQSLLDEARISSAYARLAVLIDAAASHFPGQPDSMRGSNSSVPSGDFPVFG